MNTNVMVLVISSSFVEPKAGRRHVLPTRRRTKQDFAYAMRYLVDVLYPEAKSIDVVMDNLNTHHYHSLVEFFGKKEADRIMARLCFHFTPKHASWLNMAPCFCAHRPPFYSTLKNERL